MNTAQIQTINIPELTPFFSAGVIDPIKFINLLFSEAVKMMEFYTRSEN